MQRLISVCVLPSLLLSLFFAVMIVYSPGSGVSCEVPMIACGLTILPRSNQFSSFTPSKRRVLRNCTSTIRSQNALTFMETDSDTEPERASARRGSRASTRMLLAVVYNAFYA